MPESSRYEFDNMGIGKLLKDGRLAVPPNQRSYAWEERNVRDLLQDLHEAIGRDGDEYFLGAIVLIKGDTPTIADGQQRLATITIVLSHIRDRLKNLGKEKSAQGIDTEYIQNIDIETEETLPVLSLNLDDNEYFKQHVISTTSTSQGRRDSAQRASNKRLLKATETVEDYFSKMLDLHQDTARQQQLLRWVTFIRDSANIIVVRVSDESGAYRIFETLNDRGLRAGQADLLKNYFLGRVSLERVQEAQHLWSGIGAMLETLGEDDSDLLVTYIRHLWITINGPTRERDLADLVKQKIGGSSSAIEFLTKANNSCNDYIALWSHNHPKWAGYYPETKKSIETIYKHLQVEQIRPLLFAVAKSFDVEEANKAFRLFVSWSVRFLIFGGRGGMLDNQYSKRAFEVGSGEITKARELRERMKDYVPSDQEFRTAFSTARVSRARLARYYLRSLEQTASRDEHPELIPNPETNDVDLEHILPLTVNSDWNVDEDVARALQKKLGNMVIMKSSDNSVAGNSSFATKKQVYKDSSYELTKMVVTHESWTEAEIQDRQNHLADLAVKTWPLSFD